MAEGLSSLEVRAALVEALQLDLVGPGPADELAGELLRQAPSRWYLTGFLVPEGAPEPQRADPTVTEEVDAAGEAEGNDDDLPPEPPAARRSFFPSSIGLSVLVPPDAEPLTVTIRWGDYEPEAPRGDAGEEPEGETEEVPGGGTGGTFHLWRRIPREASVEIEVAGAKREAVVPESGGLTVVATARPVGAGVTGEGGVPPGTRTVSLFLVNRRLPAGDEDRDRAFAFQAELEVTSGTPFVPRPDLRGLTSTEWDERVADLQYRDDGELGVGHGVSTAAKLSPDGRCRRVRTVWIPAAEVERVAPEPIAGVALGMEALAAVPDAAAAQVALRPLVDRYRDWIEGQTASLPAGLTSRRRETADELLKRAEVAADRIEAGIALLAADADVLDAFRTANRAMAAAARRRQSILSGVEPADVAPPAWRAFQLAFLLMNLRGVADPLHADREVVDLLFFPTGGGKTEAYLGLAAFTLVMRRLRRPGLGSAGVSVLMRYTLRLLTLDQLGRAAGLVCALELERERDPARLGEWPFEIGLWVGLAATPNRMGRKGDDDQSSARRKTIAYKNDDRKAAPIPLEQCPWCGRKFNAYSFDLWPNPDRPTDLFVRCTNRACEFSKRRLPVLGVDEPIYRRLPCFLIATVDKFAAMPWTGRVGALFGKVERADADGFYGPTDAGRGRQLDAPLPPPDLVVQDELHLIAGPMGTLVGLYETALENLSSTTVNGTTVRPKIVASTATVRRAEQQIRGLFARPVVDVFPAPGPDRRDSFFARVLSLDESPARLYLGIAAQGRSPKVVLLRSYLALLSASERQYRRAGAWRNRANPADPYMTLVGYFNSLRELGGARRIVEDEVTTRAGGYSARHRVGDYDGAFADRKLLSEVVELTSRVSTDRVAEHKRRLALPFHEKDRVDVALATNMISVGLDITRLGLMVVFGQPKTTAEYIQATSRVGRGEDRPGLVVTILNPSKPRDRSHYERFPFFHATFYRSVEATGVTPFSPRALDRGLAGTAVAMARLGVAGFTPPLGAGGILGERDALGFVVDALRERARRHAQLPPAELEALAELVRARTAGLLDDWYRIALDYQDDGVRLQYQHEEGGALPLLHQFLDPALKELPTRLWRFRANRSLRDVESEVNLRVVTLTNAELDEEDER